MIEVQSSQIGCSTHIISKCNSLDQNTTVDVHNPAQQQKLEDYSLSLSQDSYMFEQNPVATSVLKSEVCYYDSFFSKTSHSQDFQPDGIDLPKAKILVVDDNAVNRMSARTLLLLEGYEVIEASCGTAAVRSVEEHQPDLILLDVVMPGIDGYEVCQILKQNEHTRLIPVVFLTVLDDKESRIRGIEAGADDFLSKPFNNLELSARVKSLVHQKRLNEDLEHAEQVLFSVARAIESRDPNTGDHCERLVKLGEAFGKYLNLSHYQIRDLMWGGYLHDIGKVGIPDAVLLKTSKFTPEDWEIMRQHVLIGEKICQPLRSMKGVIPIIRHHHERWDGSGYPDGLRGNEIPLLAQVFQIIDIYDALTNDRPYKVALSSEEALKLMQEETNQGWRNPQLMQHFKEFIRLR